MSYGHALCVLLRYWLTDLMLPAPKPRWKRFIITVLDPQK